MPSAGARAASLAAIVAALAFAGCERGVPTAAPPARDASAFQRAVGLMGQFDFSAARAEFERLSRSDPSWHEARLNLAIATLNRQQDGDEGRAIEALRALLQDRPSDDRARYVLAIALLHAGSPAQAAPLLREVAAHDPMDPFPVYFLAQCELLMEHAEEALAGFQSAARIDPQLRSAWYGASQALARLGRADEGRRALEEFQRLRANPVSRLVEFKYTRMGRKSEAVPYATSAPARAAASGALFGPPLVLGKLARPPSGERLGITAADIDGDGIVDLVFVPGGTASPSALFMRNKEGWLSSPDHPLAKVRGVSAVAWVDVDNDGLADAILCRVNEPPLLYRQHPANAWHEATPKAFSRLGGSRDCAAFDADHDGDIDLFVVSSDGSRTLLNNNLDGTFRDLAKRLPPGAPGRARQVVAVDLDNDRDLDLIVVREAGNHEVLENDRTWSYRPAKGFEEFRRSPALAAAATDAHGDGQAEIFTLTPQLAVFEWSRDRDGAWVSRERVPAGPPAPPGPAAQIALADLDGDGRADLVKSEVDGWSAWRLLDAGATKLHEARGDVAAWHVTVLDARGPSIVDLLRDGTIRLHPPGPGRSPFALVSLSGRSADAESMRSNASGVGTRVSARVAGRSVTAQTLRPDSGPGQDLVPLAIGLGGEALADYATIDWSDGVFQTELALQGGATRRIVETQRQLSSCPLIFAWNGERMAFVSDFLGVGGLGYLVAPGEYAKPRPWENFLFPAGSLAAREGRYVVSVSEPMEEAAYIDQLRLVAYDLPGEWDMALDERMGIAGPQPTGRPVFFRRAIAPARATNDRGEDVSALLARTDGRAAPPGEADRRFIGRLASPHILTLAFDEAIDRPRALLVIDGWIEYPYSQTMFAAWQSGAAYLAPTIEALGADGRWRAVLKEFGYPAGMPRRMSVPLAGLPPGTRALRITTNQEIYFDHIAVAFAEAAPARRTELPLLEARMERAGFPLRETGAQRRPAYDHDRRAPVADMRTQSGYYTAYGTATELVAKHDDAYAILGPGDELRAEFAAPPEGPPAGWTRRFVLESRGWAKDMDLYTAFGDTVEPLPASGRYGPGSSRLNARYNSRYESGR